MWTTSRRMCINPEICGAGCGQFALAATYAHVEDVDRHGDPVEHAKDRDTHDVVNWQRPGRQFDVRSASPSFDASGLGEAGRRHPPDDRNSSQVSVWAVPT